MNDLSNVAPSNENGAGTDRLTISDSPNARDAALVETWLDEFNLSHTGIRDARHLSILVHDGAETIIAGLVGWTWGGTCEVKTLWVSEHHRHCGLGTRLMMAAEAEARARDARQIVLSTHSFQAPEFYRRIGFEIIGEIEDYPLGHRNIYMRKRLT